MPLLLISCAFSEVQDAKLLTQDSSPGRKEYHLIPLPPWRVGVHQFHQLRRRLAVHRNPVIVGEFTEEYVPSFANVHRMLHETLRVHISFENLKLGPITADKPVIAWRLCVFLLRLPDHFGGLPLESLQFPLPNRPVGGYV